MSKKEVMLASFIAVRATIDDFNREMGDVASYVDGASNVPPNERQAFEALRRAGRLYALAIENFCAEVEKGI